MNKIIISRAPVRICDIGGWTDTWFYPNGAIFNFCINLYSYVRIVQNQSGEINIISENLNQRTKIKNIEQIEYNGNLDLLKAVVKRMNIERGMNIYVKSDVPPGCGTGTSASVTVSLIAALAQLTNDSYDPLEIAKLAHDIEVKELKLESGVQDQYAAALGGVNFMNIKYPLVKIHSVKLDDRIVCQLEHQLILVYLSSRKSSEMHKAVIKNYIQGDDFTHRSLQTMKDCAYDMMEAIKSDNLELMGKIMDRNWKAQKKLHHLMVNPTIKNAEDISKRSGAIGFKMNGAGGGGSATILAAVGKTYELKKVLIQNGFQLLPVSLNFKGVQTWTV